MDFSMSLSAFRKGCQRSLAAIVSPHLHWQWSQHVQRFPSLAQEYKGSPAPSERHHRRYLCHSWGIGRRLAALVGHYEQLQCLPPAWTDRLLSQQAVLLSPVQLKGGDTLWLSLEPSDFFKEGELGLYLRDAEGERLYSLSFALGEQGQVLIGGLQGPHLGDDDKVKWLGKEMHGLRPKNLLLSSLYALCEPMGSKLLLGISDASHICSHKLKSSYDGFWLECQGQRHDRHWYRLPEREPIRDIAEVKSQRRSEFRRREALREATAQAIQTSWQQAGCAAFNA
jgi:uncharacterized protein VirK/YbjX